MKRGYEVEKAHVLGMLTFIHMLGGVSKVTLFVLGMPFIHKEETKTTT